MKHLHESEWTPLRPLLEDDQLELAPPLEEVLERARAGKRRGQPSRRWLPALVVSLGLGSAAAAGSWPALRQWWYRIRIDGAVQSEVVEQPGRREATFVTEDGVRVSVRVIHGGEGARESTRIEVLQEDASGRVEHDVESTVLLTRGTPGADLLRLGLSSLEGASELHRWIDREGRRWALHVNELADGTGSRILLQALDEAGPHPVRLLEQTQRRLGPEASLTVTENRGGSVVLELDDGHGGQIELFVGEAIGSLPAGARYESPDGRVRVEAGPVPE